MLAFEFLHAYQVKYLFISSASQERPFCTEDSTIFI